MHLDRKGKAGTSVFILQTLGSGVAVYGIPVYVAAFLRAGAASPAEISLASTAFFIAGALSGPPLSGLGQRNPNRVLLGSALATVVAITAMAVSREGPVVIAAFAILGAAFNGGFVVVGTAVVVRVFEGKPTPGMALSTSGSSAGGIVIAPVLALMLTAEPAHSGGPFLVEAAGFLVLSCAAVAFGWQASRPPAGAATPPKPAMGRGWGQLLRHWPLLVAFGLFSAANLGSTSYIVATGVSRDFAGASLAVSIATGTAVASRWVGAAGIRLLGLRRWTLTSVCLQAVGIALIGLAPAGWVLFLGAVLIGQSLGNTILIRSQVVVEAFGVDEFTRIFAQFQTWATLGSAIGPLVLGQVFALSHNYTVAYLVMCAVNVLAIPFLLPWLRQSSPTRSAHELQRAEGSPV